MKDESLYFYIMTDVVRMGWTYITSAPNSDVYTTIHV